MSAAIAIIGGVMTWLGLGAMGGALVHVGFGYGRILSGSMILCAATGPIGLLAGLMVFGIESLSPESRRLNAELEALYPTLDRKVPNTMGWRCWLWDPNTGELMSPMWTTVWHTGELRCDQWDESPVPEFHAGIHARLVPTKWETREASRHVVVRPPMTFANNYLQQEPTVVIDGIVERYGKYALGTRGWRAEWVIIRKLRAPDNEIGLQLEKAFPDVEIVYPKEQAHGHR
jgi:hypothetical protein